MTTRRACKLYDIRRQILDTLNGMFVKIFIRSDFMKEDKILTMLKFFNHAKFLLAAIFLSSLFSTAHAENYNVTNANPEGSGSLSWAIQSANLRGGSGHVITISNNLTKISFTRELTIEASITINGNGITLEGTQERRLFTVTTGHAIFDRITFTNGHAVSDNGGAVKIEGPDASAEFNNCTFYNNQADNYGGAVCVTNGSVNPRTTFTHCTISGNLAREGGGVAVLNGEASFFASIIVGNTVSTDIFKSDTGTLTGYYNVTGLCNYDMGTTNLTGQVLSSVLVIDDNGFPKLETFNNVEIIKLAGASPALDYVPSNASYTLNVDEAGTRRPMLSDNDAGAYEAVPVPVTSIDIYGLPYVQINNTGIYSAEIYPPDASRNVKDYPPYGIEWISGNTAIISMDNTGRALARYEGSANISARVHYWNSDGTAQEKVSLPLRVYVGAEERRPMQATINALDDITLGTGQYKIVTPEVKLNMNGVEITNIKGGVNYSLIVSSTSPDIVNAYEISGDSVMLMAGDNTGSSDIRVTARPLPEGDASSENFIVSVTDTPVNSDPGHSSGGGGCNSGVVTLACVLVIFAVSKIVNRKE